MTELQNVFHEYSVPATVVNKIEGCRITTYEFILHSGAKKTSITKVLDEIGVRLGVESIRMIQIPEKNAFGLEVSNLSASPVKIGDLLRSPEFKNSKKKLKYAIGETPHGKKVIGSLVDSKHLLIGGQTGSGKSVFVNVLLLGLLKESPENLRLILIDPKRVELTPYNGIPHLLTPVLTEPEQATKILDWAEKEMNRRYEWLEKVSALNEEPIKTIDKFNERLADEQKEHKMPRIVIVIDELAQLLMTSSAALEKTIVKIAQLGRAAGVHLIVATQRPSADIITPLIKANLPTKIAFAVSTGGNSRVILDRVGAEKLLGRGDMLFMEENDSSPSRIQGAYVSDDEIGRTLDFIKTNNDPPVFDEGAMEALSENKKGSRGLLDILGSNGTRFQNIMEYA